MPRPRATDSLSEQGQAVLQDGIRNLWTAARVAQAVLDATGERMTERTIARRAAEWRAQQTRVQRAREQYAAMKAEGLDGAEMLGALAFEKLLEDPDALTGSDPIKFHGLGLEAEKIALKKRELALRERQTAAVEKKLAMAEEKEQRLAAALTGEKRTITPEERLAEVYSILNLRAPEAAHVPAA